MREVLILKGIPASGKTHWAKQKIKNNPGIYKRINKDDLREMLDASHWTGSNEKFVLKTRDWLIVQALDNGKSVIVDDTNIHPKHEVRIRDIINQYNNDHDSNVQVKVKDFHVELETAIKRDKKRLNSVGVRIIKKMYNDMYKKGDPSEVHYTDQDDSLTRIVLSDIDGTVALKSDRSPYDGSRIKEDTPNKPVINILRTYKKMGILIVLLSGRSDSCMALTKEWLEENDVPYDLLLMRKDGDNRKDAIVKRELYDKFIKDKFYIEFILDDRNQVVDLWRKELHLPCFQVYYGDF